MRKHYISAWAVRGVSALPRKGEIDLIHTPNTRVVLTSEIESWAEHIDRWSAIREGFFRFFTGDGPDTDPYPYSLQHVQGERRKSFPSGAFLILVASDEAEVELTHLRETEEFGVTLDAFSVDEARAQLRPVLATASAAILSALPADSDRRIEQVGGASYVVRHGETKPIYNFSIKMHAPSIFVISPLKEELLPTLSARVGRLAARSALVRASEILLASIEEETAFGRFLLSWTALEVFVNTVFKEKYAAVAASALGDPQSPLGGALVPKTQRNHVSTAGRFLTIAFSNSVDWHGDLREFESLKTARDRFVHSGVAPNLDNHAQRSRALLLKFLNLELGAP